MENIKQTFNIISFLMVISLFIGGFIYADTNGIFTRADDLTSGIFGEDEIGDNLNYTFVDPVFLQENSSYRGVEIDARYVNYNESDVVSSFMANFTFASSSTKAGDASNSDKLLGDDWDSLPVLNQSGNLLDLDQNTTMTILHIDSINANEVTENQVAIDSVYQRDINGSCGSNQFIKSVNEDGTVVCGDDRS